GDESLQPLEPPVQPAAVQLRGRLVAHFGLQLAETFFHLGDGARRHHDGARQVSHPYDLDAAGPALEQSDCGVKRTGRRRRTVIADDDVQESPGWRVCGHSGQPSDSGGGPGGRMRIIRRCRTEPSAGYQTLWATSATSSSLRCWVSSLMRLPPMDTGEKPHWVDSASRSLPT